ncbi:IucA/IucC family protein [Marinobacter fonticola]|uniref:IucA/IucC family protein n=1 Tax=Marinobacter fonticola TaxID=2603215 RepID=UPI0011E76A91|nr:IucA/IucC family protein [Marinobacter fonticola]
MFSTALNHHYRDKQCEDLAGQRSMDALLNCYCRDIAAPASELQVAPPDSGQSWPQALRLKLATGNATALMVQLPELAGALLLAVSRDSLAGSYRFQSAPFYKSPSRGWQVLDLARLARVLLQNLALRFGQPFNGELYQQVLGSREVMRRILSYSQVPADWGQGLTGYRWSEQALSFGHRYHPAPKAREGFSEEDTLQYSPEMGGGFALYYFAIRREDLRSRGLSAGALENLGAPAGLAVPPGFVALPVHPWQARYLMRQSFVLEAIRSRRIQPLGQGGSIFYPTASVRTLYQPGNAFFYKFSTHVRLTNCVRKNAYYELESAVALSHLLRNRLEPLLAGYPGFELMYEPAYVTLDFTEAEDTLRHSLMEGFGLILRNSLEPLLENGVTPVLAASLFSEDRFDQCPVKDAVDTCARAAGLNRRQATIDWFERYLELLMPPVLDALFIHGVVFEPHLQNVVVGLKNGWPAQVFVRDLEGTKLVAGLWSEPLPAGLDERVQASIHYSADKGWKRIAYCLLINNLFQAVSYLALDDLDLETDLWRVWRAHLERYLDRCDSAWAHRVIGGLLRGEPLPNKSNLITRLLKRADRDSEYVQVPNPLAALTSAPPARDIRLGPVGGKCIETKGTDIEGTETKDTETEDTANGWGSTS